MKIGYPCINTSLDCSGNRTFRLKSYSESRLKSIVKNNLSCLEKIIRYNIEHNILFFRITSDLVPFASHPICKFDWTGHFTKQFSKLGELIRSNGIRISMHPDQFIVLNSKDPKVVSRSVAELKYHAEVLALLGLDNSAKIQLHVGGVYGNKKESITRFKSQYSKLDRSIKERLVIENDDRSYSISDCLELYKETGIPILLDNFHHELNSSGQTIIDVLEKASKTWKEKDGLPMTDYSSQNPNLGKGRHAETIDIGKFKEYIKNSKPIDFDIMLEIKDKENSAKKAVEVLIKDDRFFKIR